MFKVVLKDFSDTIHETKIFNSKAEAELLIKQWAEITSGAVRGFIEEIEELPAKLKTKVSKTEETSKSEAKDLVEDLKTGEEDLSDDVKKVLDKSL